LWAPSPVHLVILRSTSDHDLDTRLPCRVIGTPTALRGIVERSASSQRQTRTPISGSP